VTFPLRRAASLGAQVAATPLRLLENLAEPVREDLRRDLRRSLGAPGRPIRAATDPAEAFLDPGAIARRVHGDLPSMLIGGLSALFLQSLHPLAMAGVAEHSRYEDDPLGRLRRTAAFVGYTTFGTTHEARQAIETVRRVHQRVRGVAPDGRCYAASDPELVTWVHAAEMWSFLTASRRFGTLRLSPGDCDRYYAETAPVAFELGAKWVPRSSDEMAAYFRRVRPELYAGPQARYARDFLLRGVARRPEDRLVYALLVDAAVGLLPLWARRELELPNLPLFGVAGVPMIRLLCAGLRWAVQAPPGLGRG
jgi:uncharacterized protein (DUF2236 family)